MLQQLGAARLRRGVQLVEGRREVLPRLQAGHLGGVDT